MYMSDKLWIMKTEDVAESHQRDFPYMFPAGHETRSCGTHMAVAAATTPLIKSISGEVVAAACSYVWN